MSTTVLRELAIRGELAAVHGQERRSGAIEIDDVIARDAFRIVHGSGQQRAQAGKGPDDVVHAEVALKVPVGHVEQVRLLGRGDRGMREVAGVFAFRRADQREVALVGQGEHDAAVGRLEDVREFVIEQLAHDDVAAADHARMVPGGRRRAAVEELRDPRSRRVHHEPRPQGSFATVGCAQCRDPFRAITLQPDAGSARQHLGAALERIDGIGNDQSRIVDPAIRIFEARAVTRVERLPGGMRAQVDLPRRRQASCASRGGRTGRARRGSSTRAAGASRAAARSAAATPDAVRTRSTTSRSRSDFRTRPKS